jgi:hypothetical protein
MQWADLNMTPTARRLREFAGIWLVVFGGISAWRAWHGDTGVLTTAIGVAAAVIGLAGLIRPALVRVVYTGSMMAAFPIGWTVSRLVLGIVFYLVFTPVAIVFRLAGRDALRLRRRRPESYWVPYEGARRAEEYFRQS